MCSVMNKSFPLRLIHRNVPCEFPLMKKRYIQPDLSIKTNSSNTNPNLGIIVHDSLSIGQHGLIIDGKHASKITSYDDIENLGQFLGRGATASVWKVRHKISNQIYALKVIRLENRDILGQRLAELKALHHSTHHCIVSFYGAFYINAELHLILEYMDAGTLGDLLFNCKTITESILSSLAHQIVLGLEYLHKEIHVVHRDIKPQNILINRNGEVKITDFGVCSELAHSLDVVYSFKGTAKYMSPERLKGGEYTIKCDIWSLGIVLFQCAVGYYPYDEKLSRNYDYWSLLNIIVGGDAPKLPVGSFSDQFHNIINSCLQKNDADRPDCTTLLGDKWFTLHDQNITPWLSQYTSNNNN